MGGDVPESDFTRRTALRLIGSTAGIALLTACGAALTAGVGVVTDTDATVAAGAAGFGAVVGAGTAVGAAV